MKRQQLSCLLDGPILFCPPLDMKLTWLVTKALLMGISNQINNLTNQLQTNQVQSLVSMNQTILVLS